LRRLQAVTDAALSRLDGDNFLGELLDRALDLLGADTAAVLMLDPTDQVLVVSVARGIEKDGQHQVRIPVDHRFVGQVVARRQALQISGIGASDVANPVLIERGITSIVGAPMIAAGRVIGVVHLGTLTPRRFTDDDIEVLQLVAERMALVTEAHRAHLDRAAAIALQRSLLPARPATCDGLDVAVRYVPGSQAGVGGDWYDVFALPTGHVGITIGDVTGNGLRAAVVMGRIRSALRAYAIDSDDPADVLTRLDRKIQMFEPGAMATVLYAVIEPSRETMTVSVAGHPPPVLAEVDQPTRLVDITVDLPLGAYPNAPRHTTDVNLPAGATLFLYTDGLIERRDRPLTHGLQKLRAIVNAAPAETVCAAVTAAFLDDATATDDVAILALHRTSASSA
jgi:serine phosphatase RsbU (regulator of sigma subunit)